MNVKLLRRVREMYQSRYYQRQWVRSVRLLGDRWLLAHPVERRS
jgi:hypothetical protein